VNSKEDDHSNVHPGDVEMDCLSLFDIAHDVPSAMDADRYYKVRQWRDYESGHAVEI
jgi:hypothetical protein